MGSSPIKKQHVGEKDNEVPSAAQLGAVFTVGTPTPHSVSLTDPIVQLSSWRNMYFMSVMMLLMFDKFD